MSLHHILPLFACLAAFAGEPDYHSYSNFEQVRVTHVALDLNVSFESKTVGGTAELYINNRQSTRQLILDTRGLAIASAEASTNGLDFQRTSFSVGEADAILGAPLKIAIPEATRRVRITYASAANASGLHWLSAAQTAGRRAPFFYTQSWSIHARSWVPLQDSPQVKFTYSANIHTPTGLLAVMSAENNPEAPRNGNFHFEMRQPIPPYGLALAVGDIAFRSLGARTGVYADPSLIEKSAKEFEDTERMLNAAESIAGAYRWERYDVLLLPPGALYGGMENPRLTFLAASALAGDKSAAATVAHELAHSWSGNLVTNATWSDIWISEGIATYFANRIQAMVYGPHRSAIETWLGWQNLKNGLDKLTPSEQILNPPSKGLDPDNLLGPIPYQKGALFLRTLESVAGREKMDEFLRRYFARFAYESITSADALAYMKFIGLNPQDGWLDQPSLPAGAAVPQTDPLAPVTRAAAQWRRRARIETRSWITAEWLQFIAQLSAKDLARADAKFHFTQSTSTPIIIAIYAELAKTSEGKSRAALLLSKYRPAYADSLAAQLEKLLKP